MRTRIFWSLAAFAIGGVVFACGSSDDDGPGASNGGTSSGGTATGGSPTGGTGAGSSGASGGSGGTGGSSATGGTSTGGVSGVGGSSGGGGSSATDAGLADVIFNYDAPPEPDGGIGDACANTTVKADPIPLDMYIVQDNSGSMADPAGLPGDCNLGQTVDSKWCYAINALDKFFKAAPAGTGVALQYFPKCWKSQAECSTGASCATPEVPLGQLPGNLSALESSLNLNLPSGTTPTEAALRGITTFTKANQQSGRVMIGILITDGIPEACDLSTQNLKNIVEQHFVSTGIKTFVIGMTGANYSVLNTIASPGGAPTHTQYCGTGPNPCYYYDVGKGDGTAFTAVLSAIQKFAVGCQYNVPTPAGGIPDPSKVEVLYTPNGSTTAQKLPKVTNAAACGTTGGWYYDNNSNPKVIYLCPGACSVVQADPQAKIDVNLGCLGS